MRIDADDNEYKREKAWRPPNARDMWPLAVGGLGGCMTFGGRCGPISIDC